MTSNPSGIPTWLYGSRRHVEGLPLRLLAAVACSASVACSGSSDDKGPVQDPGIDMSQYTEHSADPCKNLPDTEFPNDDLCLEPPPPDLGFQIYVGPGAGNYDDPVAMEPYRYDPGDPEKVVCVSATTPNVDVVYSREHHIRTRTGTHHIIYWRDRDPANSTIPADGTISGDCRDIFSYAFFIGMESAISSEGGRLDAPLPTKDVSKYTEEERGMAMKVAAKTRLQIETHFVNTGDTPILREAWANVMYADPAGVTKILDPIFFIGGLAMAVPPLTRQIVGGGPVERPDIPEEVRFMALAGHAHANTLRETAYLNHSDGRPRDIVYQTYDWAEPLWAQFDYAHDNPPIQEGMDGAITGPFVFQPGDTLTWECDVDNQFTNLTLRFGDLAYEAEMCNMFGYYTPGSGGYWPKICGGLNDCF